MSIVRVSWPCLNHLRSPHQYLLMSTGTKYFDVNNIKYKRYRCVDVPWGTVVKLASQRAQYIVSKLGKYFILYWIPLLNKVAVFYINAHIAFSGTADEADLSIVRRKNNIKERKKKVKHMNASYRLDIVTVSLSPICVDGIYV